MTDHWSLPGVDQIGIYVRDLHGAIAALEELHGIGPFRVVENEVTELSVRGGPPMTVRGHGALCTLEPLEIELVENPMAKRIGVQHLGFFVHDYEARVEEMRRRGVPVMQSGRLGKMRFTYYEPAENSGLVVEFVEAVDPSDDVVRKAITEAGQPSAPRRGIDQIGMVVRSVERAAQSLQEVYGIGPFHFHKESELVDMVVRGEPSANITLRGASCMLGPVQIELIEPLRGPSIYHEHLASGREGFHHLGVFVRDYDDRVEEMRRHGVRVLQSGRVEGKMHFTYYEPDDSSGVIVEFAEYIPRR